MTAVQVVGGSYQFTTKHRIEIVSVVQAHIEIMQPCRVNIVTDFGYVVKVYIGHNYVTTGQGHLLRTRDTGRRGWIMWLPVP